MIKTFDSQLKLIGWVMLVNALLHVLAYPLSGFASDGLMLVPFGIIYALLAFGVWRDWRKLCYLIFLFAIFGAIAAAMAIGNPPIPSIVNIAIVVCDIVAAVLCFLHIWKRG